MICNLDHFAPTRRALSEHSPHQAIGFLAGNHVVHRFYFYLRILFCGAYIYTVQRFGKWKNHCYDWDLNPYRSNGFIPEREEIVKLVA